MRLRLLCLRSALLCSVVVVGPTIVKAADLDRWVRERPVENRYALFAGDDRCNAFEANVYKPRLVGEPGCYAARPYGMSSRLYDYPAVPLRD